MGKRNLTIQEKGHFKGADAVENLLRLVRRI